MPKVCQVGCVFVKKETFKFGDTRLVVGSLDDARYLSKRYISSHTKSQRRVAAA